MGSGSPICPICGAEVEDELDLQPMPSRMRGEPEVEACIDCRTNDEPDPDRDWDGRDDRVDYEDDDDE